MKYVLYGFEKIDTKNEKAFIIAESNDYNSIKEMYTEYKKLGYEVSMQTR